MNAEATRLALEWLAFAFGDLEAARSRKGRHVRPRHVANLAQQAAEKALKAALVLEGVKPPPKHDLDDLRTRLPETWRVKRHPKDLSRLTDYGVDVKYPDSAIQVTPLQAAVAVRQAIAVIRAVRHDFERLGIRVDGLRPE
jgi:HEPN domain-containing protein